MVMACQIFGRITTVLINKAKLFICRRATLLAVCGDKYLHRISRKESSSQCEWQVNHLVDYFSIVV